MKEWESTLKIFTLFNQFLLQAPEGKHTALEELRLLQISVCPKASYKSESVLGVQSVMMVKV